MNKKRMFENIYDLLLGNALSDKQQDDWAVLHREMEKKARQELRKFTQSKSMEWDGDNNTISIGKHFRIVLE